MSVKEIGEGFPKSLRLLTSKDFDRLKSGASVFQNSILRVYSKKAEFERDHARFGFAISRKVGKAHDRNRLKRIMRDFVRRHPLRTLDYDLLFVVSPRTLQGPDAESCERRFKSSLEDVVQKISTSKHLKS